MNHQSAALLVSLCLTGELYDWNECRSSCEVLQLHHHQASERDFLVRLSESSDGPSSEGLEKDGRLAQLVRAPALQAGGRRFESCTAHHSTPNTALAWKLLRHRGRIRVFGAVPLLCPPRRDIAERTCSCPGGT